MKRYRLVTIFLVIILLVGCTNTVTKSQVDTTTRVEEKNGNIETATTKKTNQSKTSSPTSIQSSNSSNYVKTYQDETHKNIKYEKLSFSIGSYHIVSNTSSDNIETFKCEIDKGEGYSWTKTHMNITVRAIEKQDFLDTESMVAHLCDMYPNNDNIKIYSNVTDNSGIINLYILSEGDQTKYVVCYKESYYLIDSDVDEIYLLENYPSEYYEVYNQKIECANSNITTVNETISYNNDEFEKAEYVIIQGKGGTKYFAELSRDEEHQYHFTIKNEKNKKLLKLSTYGEFYDVIKFLDVNMDGYADIQFLKEPGTVNNRYDLYVWNNTASKFVKVKCDEMLSYFEVYDGYLLNWQKESVNSGVIQKLVWKNKNTLIKESEEPYCADDNKEPISSTTDKQITNSPSKTILPSADINSKKKYKENLCTVNEEVLFSFKLVNSPKTLSVYVSKTQPNYIMYRFGTKDKVELEFPKNNADSWSKFTYSYYLRGGGAGNEGMDLNYLTFQNGGYEYQVYQEYTAKDNETNVGVKIFNLSFKHTLKRFV